MLAKGHSVFIVADGAINGIELLKNDLTYSQMPEWMSETTAAIRQRQTRFGPHSIIAMTAMQWPLSAIELQPMFISRFSLKMLRQ